MRLTRRKFLAAGAAALAAGVAGAADDRRRMGVVIHSYGIHQAADREHFADPLAFLEFCRARGAGVRSPRQEADTEGRGRIQDSPHCSSLHL